MNDPIEELAALEHRQWMHWSKETAELLEEILNALANQKFITECSEEESKKSQKIIDTLWNQGMKKLVNWRRYWIDYEKLDEGIKDLDRRWAFEAYNLAPIKCPVWQCGGYFESVEQKPPEGNKNGESYSGDWQTPNLVCNNCGAIYAFKGFKGGKE